ncbi:type III-A CRISPR-associated RAMP protein Csm5 [Methanothermococcus okinawensis]|uniref:CRISPR system Cms protein Csm5 n=1 Tax=Methanothermococcus okinawensis (strain DSM 14208 / JCM 11175 / IH1) TaxID=647113 RepID=F8AJQ8_METOI|nr:type III-A CRISPR-associated RAMP protein Csm5 [Methanothermococcus okinawensis]AEH07256.1 CRISPR-associated RAMP protein, Csm5 family [Methanothermococcus okinawensis IH1]
MNIFRPDESKTKNNGIKSTKKVLKITTISPLNIGNGDVYSNMDYYIENGKAKIINMEELFENIKDIHKIDELTKLIKHNMNNNRMELSVKEAYESIGLYLDEHILKEVNCNIKMDAKIQVKKFINQNGKYYVPGSSLKGAIRTAYIFDYYDKHIDKLVNILENKKIHDNKKGNEVVKTAIGGIKDDFFKYLLITDSNIIPPENFEFINTIRYNTMDAKKGKKSNTIPEPKEVLKKNSELRVELTIKDGFPKNFEDIKNMCNKFSKTVVEFELNNKYLPQETIKFYNNLLNNIKNNDNSFYLAIGSGSSYLSKTIYLLLWKHDKGNKKGYLNIMKNIFEKERNRKLKASLKGARHYIEFPRTRVLDSNKNIPMGWVKITEDKNE